MIEPIELHLETRMKSFQLTALAGISLVLALSSHALAETKVEVKGTHLCCPACVKAVAAILKDVEGVQGKCDPKAKTITITAKDDEAAQKALDALAAGGFHGDTGNDKLKMKDDSGAEAGKVKTVTVSGIHNCCGQCNAAIKATVKKVEGVQGDTAKAKSDTFEVSGDFDAAELVKALNAAGFHVKVKK
jgi:copper chaperone CopZ